MIRQALHMMFGVALVALALVLVVTLQLHGARSERDALHADLVQATLQRDALREKARVQAARVAAHDDILASCQYDNARLAVMWAEAIRGAPEVAESD